MRLFTIIIIITICDEKEKNEEEKKVYVEEPNIAIFFLYQFSLVSNAKIKLVVWVIEWVIARCNNVHLTFNFYIKIVSYNLNNKLCMISKCDSRVYTNC